jgi:hypothetical protein
MELNADIIQLIALRVEEKNGKWVEIEYKIFTPLLYYSLIDAIKLF